MIKLKKIHGAETADKVREEILKLGNKAMGDKTSDLRLKDGENSGQHLSRLIDQATKNVIGKKPPE